MEPITADILKLFFQRLSTQYPRRAEFYLLGGSALCLLGSPRETLDVDYALNWNAGNVDVFQAIIEQLGSEMKLDMEAVPLGEFIPLPPEAEQRRRLIGSYEQIDVYIFDLYSIALSKIARGFEADLEDVQFLLGEKLIDFAELQRYFEIILPDASRYDIDRKEFRAYFEELKRRIHI